MSFDYAEAERFYQDDGDKIKINWFCYEYANNLFMEIRSSVNLTRYRQKYTQEQIVLFCVYFAKRLRKSIFDAQAGSVGNMTLNGVYISEFYPDAKHSQKRMLLEAAERAWERQMLGCSGCVNHCLHDGYGKTEMFDRLKQTGWPT
jgi:hypothetical protein